MLGLGEGDLLHARALLDGCGNAAFYPIRRQLWYLCSVSLGDLPQMRFEEHEHARYGLNYGDLVICEGGEPGRCAIWKDQVPNMKIQKALHRVRPLQNLNNIFLHYWFLFANTTGILEPYFTGTTIKHLTGRALAKLEIPLPPLAEQEAIAHLLGTLDDKIELNRQINSTLEAMAQALFKSWFVGFDPVIDNALAAGNPIPDELADRAERRKQLHANRSAEAQPLPAAIQQQFPDRFVFTEEMGWVPEGWEAAPIAKLADLNPESWTAKKHPDVLHYVDLSNTKSGRINETIVYKFSEAPSRARRVLRKDDSIIGTVRPGNRSFAFIHNDGLTGSTGFAVMRPRRPIFRSYTYLALTREKVIEMFAHLADGGAYPAIRPDVVASQYVVIPCDALLSEFDQRVYPWLTKIGTAETMNEALAKTRDTLLPKLFSGQLRIPEAEQLLAEAL